MKRKPQIIMLIALILLVGCSKPTPAPTPVVTAAPPTESPTPTSAPMALLVNGEGITLEEYNGELIRLQMALTEIGQEMTPEAQKERLITSFTDELLLEQAAVQGGYTVSDAQVQEHIDKLVADIGGADKLTAWMSTFGYSEAIFRASLKRQMLVTWQRDQIIDSVPTVADQVHAKQLLYQDKAVADDALSKIKSGVDFATLANTQDPVLGGDLGWFPRGTLTQPAVEEAAFSLAEGAISEVIQSDIGYHIVKVIERDSQHVLSVEARRILQEAKLDEWLNASRAVSAIQVLVP